MIPLPINPAAVLGFVLDTLKFLFEPKVWLLLAVAGALGFFKGCADERERHEAFVAAVKRVGDEQNERTRKTNDLNRRIQKEMDDAHRMESDRLRGDLAAAHARLRDRTGRSFVPGPSASAGEPVQASSCANERERLFLNRIYSGEIVCYPGREMDQRVRIAGERVLRRLAGLSEPAVVALDDARWWGEWAVKVDACRAQ